MGKNELIIDRALYKKIESMDKCFGESHFNEIMTVIDKHIELVNDEQEVNLDY